MIVYDRFLYRNTSLIIEKKITVIYFDYLEKYTGHYNLILTTPSPEKLSTN